MTFMLSLLLSIQENAGLLEFFLALSAASLMHGPVKALCQLLIFSLLFQGLLHNSITIL